MWIADHQMWKETQDIVQLDNDFLPLETLCGVVKGNALRMNWEDVVPKEKLNYIIGNPPFIGSSLKTKEQKNDMETVCLGINGKPIKSIGKIDYVGGWYFKAAKLMQGTNIRAALVSTNSITQGEQVVPMWQPLFNHYGVHIDFAYKTFRWDSESSGKAQVYCVIIGFSTTFNDKPKVIYNGECKQIARNINPYLMDAPNIFVEPRYSAICDIPEICKGFQTTDFGYLTLNEEERQELIKNPENEKWIRPFSQGEEFINNTPRYCLWLVDIDPNELRQLNDIKKRVNDCRVARENAPTTGDAYKLKDTPHLFRTCKQFKDKPYIAAPLTSSENRKYIPMDFINDGTIPGNGLFCIFNASPYHFGILMSNIHMAWLRTICGRLGNGYRYSKDIVYNNFPWPTPTDEQKTKIEQTVQAILDARALYPDSSLADLYDECTMPIELRKAHEENDKAVMAAYGWDKKHPAYNSESIIVKELFKMYQELTSKL